jgi:hypothetical protein
VKIGGSVEIVRCSKGRLKCELQDKYDCMLMSMCVCVCVCVLGNSLIPVILLLLI